VLSNSQGSGPSGATHAATAIRYGCNGLLARERRLLNKANPTRAGFYGFLIIDAEAAAEVDRGGSQRLCGDPSPIRGFCRTPVYSPTVNVLPGAPWCYAKAADIWLTRAPHGHRYPEAIRL
jgi:hypothetical protein